MSAFFLDGHELVCCVKLYYRSVLLPLPLLLELVQVVRRLGTDIEDEADGETHDHPDRGRDEHLQPRCVAETLHQLLHGALIVGKQQGRGQRGRRAQGGHVHAHAARRAAAHGGPDWQSGKTCVGTGGGEI